MNTTGLLVDPPAIPSSDMETRARDHQNQLTKPPGSLGRLEDLAITLAHLQATATPSADRARISVFVADHGVAGAGVSAFPQAVTVQMLRNLASGGAAISVLARALDASLEVINLGTVSPAEGIAGVRDHILGPGTDNMAEGPAMTEARLQGALTAGREAVERASSEKEDLFIGGEMGIGNTTSATALACALLDTHPRHLAGPGTGLDTAGVAHKARVIEQALERHRPHLQAPLEIMRCLGGFEIAALGGAFTTAAQRAMPVLIDGFVASVAALFAVRLQPEIRPWLIFSHRSAEPGHGAVLEAMGACPLLDMGMRLGEGSGAAAALPLLRLACKLHNEMATFESAGVAAG